MEPIFIVATTLVCMVLLKVVFKVNKKKAEPLKEDKELETLTDRFPENIDIAKEMLEMLDNKNVKIEEGKSTETSLYIAITNKILIADMKNNYARIQTIAHECLHSIQDRKILLFNFAFSNIYLMYFIIICVLGLLKMLPLKMMFLAILLLLSICYYMVRIYLENDAMLKAKYLAKEYMEEQKISTRDEITEMVEEFDKINNIGIKCVNYNFFLNIMIKVIIFTVICIIR